MTNVIEFPTRSSIRIIAGINRATGAPIYLLEYVEGQGTMIVDECHSVAQVIRSLAEWEADGVPVIDHLEGDTA